tara:strand:- start:2 stop:376 length:375 start_codon:yes stop_codon:yes gene_type:complete
VVAGAALVRVPVLVVASVEDHLRVLVLVAALVAVHLVAALVAVHLVAVRVPVGVLVAARVPVAVISGPVLVLVAVQVPVAVLALALALEILAAGRASRQVEEELCLLVIRQVEAAGENFQSSGH